jgi:hypothetical protein
VIIDFDVLIVSIPEREVMEKEILWQINPNLRVTYNVRYS